MVDYLGLLRAQRPLIHCITNPISMQLCANALLAIGARPIMAEHPMEVEEIAETAGALLLNLGTITPSRVEAMKRAAHAAAGKRIPVLVDAVGVACSGLRRELLLELLSIAAPVVIKGNYSELLALARRDYRASGVDVDTALEAAALNQTFAALARRYGTIVLASGKTDIVTDGEHLLHLKNGTAQLTTITGTGCMLGALTAACLAIAPELEAAAFGCALLGVCGELAETERGPGSFQVNLLDTLAAVDTATIQKHIKMEETVVETL